MFIIKWLVLFILLWRGIKKRKEKKKNYAFYSIITTITFLVIIVLFNFIGGLLIAYGIENNSNMIINLGDMIVSLTSFKGIFWSSQAL